MYLDVQNGWKRVILVGFGIILCAAGHGQITTSGLRTAFKGGSLAANETVASLAPINQVVSARQFQAGLRADGSVVVWGYGSPSLPQGLVGVSKLSAGYDHVLALMSDGSVVGFGTYDATKQPANLKAVQLAAAYRYSVALRPDGTVVMWGRDTGFKVPAGLAGVTQISAATNSLAFLKTNGTVVMVGDKANGKIDVPAGLPPVVQVAAAQDHTVALLSDGTVRCWGSDYWGQCTPPTGLKSVVKIAAGTNASFALRKDGTIVRWGDKRLGNVPAGVFLDVECSDGSEAYLKADHSVFILGGGDFAVENPPQPISNTVAISSGGNYLHAVAADGTVRMRGVSSTEASVPSGLKDVVQLVAGDRFQVALKKDGTVTAWGLNNDGQTKVPVGLKSVKQVVAGDSHAVALKTDGTVVAWGGNSYSQTTLPTGLKNIKQLVARGGATLALKTDGTLVGWGHATSILLKIPDELKDVEQIVAGNDFVAARRTNGTVVGWGLDSLGGGGKVPGNLDNVVRLLAGTANSFAVALYADGTSAAWGYFPNQEPGQDHRFDGVVQFASGWDTTYALFAVNLMADQWSIPQGGSTLVRMTLPVAPLKNVDVPVTSSSLQVSVPPLVRVAAGSHTAEFLVKSPGSFEGTSVIAAKYAGATAHTTVTVYAPRTAVISVDPTSVKGGSPMTGTVKLTSGTAPVGGTVVKVSTSQASAVPPASVTIPAGASQTSFAVTTSPVPVDTVAVLTAKLDLAVRTSSLTVKAPLLSDLKLASNALKSGETINGTVYLDGPAPKESVKVALSSNQPSALVPASVTVPPGKSTASFTVTAGVVSEAVRASIAAKSGSIEKTVALTINPSAPVISEVSLDPSTVRGDDQSKGMVKLAVIAPAGGVKVNLASASKLAVVPTSVTVPAGQQTATFTVSTVPVKADQAVKITASIASGSKSAILTITPPALTSVSPATSKVKGGASTIGTVVIDAPAPVGGLAVALTSDDPSVTIPAGFTIPEGALTATFAIVTKSVKVAIRVTLTASFNGKSVKGTLTVNP